MKEVTMWTISINNEWNILEENFSWVRDMQNVPQDHRHHAEGNVAVHTQMVLEALTGLEAFQSLHEQEKEILWASALLHDVEKRSVTVVEADGSITAHGHARKGAMTTRQLLYREVPTPFTIREQIVSLVRHHGLPLWMLEKPDPVKTLVKASLEVDTRWLALLARADALGRICQDREDLLYRIGCFEEFCKEHHCWAQPRPFTSNHARMYYLNQEHSSLDYAPFEISQTEVVLMSGLPGAGKDSYIRRHFPDRQVVSLDALRVKMKIGPTDKSGNGRVIQAAKEQARVLLRGGAPFVWNATNITRSMRVQLIELFRSYGASVKIIYVESSYEQLIRQNKNREAVVPAQVLEKLIDKLEVPALWEAEEVIYWTGQ